MRVVCPQCNAAYQIDDARVPERGASVKCSKCQTLFPVKRAAPAEAPGSGAVPLPGSGKTGGIPLPSPARAAGSPPPPAIAPPPRPASAGVPLPSPFSPFGDAPTAPPAAAASPFDAGPAAVPPSPFDAGAAAESSPFDAGPVGFPASPFGAPEGPFGGSDSPFGAGPFAGGETPFGAAPAAPAAPPPSPAASLSFGEVDLGDAPAASPPDPFASAGPPAGAPPPPPADDPFDLTPRPPLGASAPPPPPVMPPPPPAEGEELENLFGESPRPPPPAPARAGGYQVRRRSGKVFGPFAEQQIIEMLSKGELLGNEDVSLDGTDYQPIGAVAAFGAALRKAAAAEPASKPAAPAVFGDRMAGAKVVDGTERRPMPRWVKWAALAAPVVAVLAAGVGAGFTRHGFFFAKELRRGDPVALANLSSQARTALARGDFPSARSALDHASRAVAAAPRAGEAILLHAVVAATLEQVHGAPSQALDQARKGAAALEQDEKGEVSALAARLAMSLAADPPATTVAAEAALESALAKRKPDAELVALLARSALARGDATRAAGAATRLAALEKGPRGPMLLAQATILRGKPDDARAALLKVFERDKDFAEAHLELAALDERAGALDRARERLEPLVASANRSRLAPAHLARALAILGTISCRDPARAADGDKLLEEAVAADPRLAEARIRLAQRRMSAGDAAGAVTATEAVATAPSPAPGLAAVRVRALAMAGRTLDAIQLADKALASAQGNGELIVAKAYALAGAGKPDDARKLYDDALARDRDAVEPRVALARFALAAGDLARAGELLTAAVQKGPRDAAAQAATGDLLAARNDPAGAEAAFRKALELDPAHAPAEVGLARLALAKGDAGGARTWLDSAVKHDPRNAEVLVEHATLLWKAGELAPAEADLTSAIEISPKHAVALARLGAVLLQKGDAEAAVRRLTAASNEAPGLLEARLWLGRALLARGETPGAIAQLKKAVDLQRNVETLLALGIALEKQGSLPDALEAYKGAAAAGPTQVEPQERIADLYAANSQCDKALPAFARSIELDPKASRLRVGQAQCLAGLGKHEQAVQLLEALLKADPRATPAYYLLARSLHESKGLAAALPSYERAAKEEPANPMPHYYLGYAYKQRNQKAKAVEEFRKFLQRKPDAPEKKDIEAEIEDLGGK
jgi:predicted Zn finger-like uncharacterized protein